MADVQEKLQADASFDWTPPPGWPVISRDRCREILTAPGQRFEMETIDIRGVPTRVWKNAPPNLRAIVLAGQAHGDRVFTIYEDERVTFDAWFRAVATLAHDLQARGIGKGDRVAVAMRNLPEWPVAFFAAVSIGAICVPLNAWWTGPELAYGLADSGTRALICDDERWERIAPHHAQCPDLETVLVARSAQAPAGAIALEGVIGTPPAYATLPQVSLPDVAIAPDDDATIFYTSGTTGKPKGALGTHRNLCTNVLSSGYNAACAVLRRGEPLPEPKQKVGLTVIPLFHVTACSAGLIGNIAAGNTMIFMRKWDAVKAFQIIEGEKVNSTGGVPTIAWQMIEHPERKNYDLSSIEAIAYGGAPSAPELVRKIREVFGALPGNGWGMTETMATVTGHSSEDYLNRPDSCGPAVAVADLKIMDADGVNELPAGQVGELWARGPMVVKGYWNSPEATAATFVNGWVRTGDLARLDDEGFCFIVDRAKDMIIRGGENIYSSEVENVLYDHPAVTDAALVGLPHQQLGEEPAAVVHLAPGTQATEAELQQWVADRLARFKVPVRIVFSAETLPRNANGKILKKELSALF
ncbi:MAG: fatty acid--CoA ligase [Novosphingobium sp. 17-62-19]|uniref:class I adenylate-forming enzyme family protein n=1 Tax=Novosphingobium sp. 17-62-19 TaxID=1970406 RepID=UPI000BDACF09|nr:class I adenylate-forming enzyme family protein [Novosphingobium sp. 17-62-19]OYX95093.1 MAG: fatty acid--CoA ligase [Novosphingobium sp. 35-62-5]OZA21633.1 MAG: fatty acid--CoA ligase [Novosphingobium sp. 17-62-19]HQS96878.1 class I adenylate-forming enzyme family protein [Novosphingobium sp.]